MNVKFILDINSFIRFRESGVFMRMSECFCCFFFLFFNFLFYSLVRRILLLKAWQQKHFTLTWDLFRANKQRKHSLYPRLSFLFGKTKLKRIPTTFLTCRSFVRWLVGFSRSCVFSTKYFCWVRMCVGVYNNACQLK